MQADATSGGIAPIQFLLAQLKRTNPAFDNYFLGVNAKFDFISDVAKIIGPFVKGGKKKKTWLEKLTLKPKIK